MSSNDDVIKEIVQNTLIDFNGYLRSIENTCNYLMQRAIQSSVYYVYRPKMYDRTFDFLKSVETSIQDNSLYVYVDTNALYYPNVNYRVNVASILPWLIEEGHHDNDKVQDEFHHYNGRRYLEMAQYLIEEATGMPVQIVNNEPNWLNW